MGVTLGNLKKQRRVPNARTVKKHSDIVRRESANVVVGGHREKTDTGFIVRGFLGKSFETYFEYMEVGSSTALLQHEKKDKTVRVLSGLLYVMIQDGKVSSQTKAMSGDEIVLERGTTYRLATSTEPVQLVVCQNSKYDHTVKVVDDTSKVGVAISPNLLVESTFADRTAISRPQDAPTRRKGSKAKEQLAAQRSGKRSPQIVELPGKLSASATFGKNPRPSQGNFSDEGAG